MEGGKWGGVEGHLVAKRIYHVDVAVRIGDNALPEAGGHRRDYQQDCADSLDISRLGHIEIAICSYRDLIGVAGGGHGSDDCAGDGIDLLDLARRMGYH